MAEDQTQAAPPLTPREARLIRAVKSYERAHIELCRADSAYTQPRMQKAGDRMHGTRSKLFCLAREMTSGR